MKEINNAELKEGIAKKIKELAAEINKQIDLANSLRIRVNIIQQPPMAMNKNSYITAIISEIIMYH